MLIPYEKRKIFIASKPIDLRMSIDRLCSFVQDEKDTYLHDGSIYVFYNQHQDKIKCLFWDNNGFVTYYKRLDNCKFKFRKMLNSLQNVTADELQTILSGFDPNSVARKPVLLEHVG